MTRDELAATWRAFGETECRGYSSLYEKICGTVARSDAVLDRLLPLPEHAHQPNLLLAAVHDLVLRGNAPTLADLYNGSTTGDVGRVFANAVIEGWGDVLPLLEARRTQTNEIGRIAVLAPALAAVDVDDLPTVIDVGTSAGLTLTMDHCLIDYGSLGQLGPSDSPVRVTCDVVHGHPPIRATPVARRIGIDRRPLDPTNPDDARWLLACTWPDTGRLDRTRAALELAAAYPNELRVGDAVTDVGALLDEVSGPVIITTTWVLAYLSDDHREAFSAVLAAASRHRPVRWISVEAPGIIASLPRVELADVNGAASVLGAVHYEDGQANRTQVLAHVHPHGRWLWWHEAESPSGR